VLGIVEELERDRGYLPLYSPPFEGCQIASVQFGSIRLERSGQELCNNSNADSRVFHET
jgi:hypothetical protein